jgi:pimeloyl-ACP methyl ester esterase
MPWFENEAGNRLWYEEHGAGTPIVFIHGWCMSSAVWGLQRESLSDSFRVITLDLRGHGNSPAHTDSFHIKGCAADIVGLIEHLGIYDAILAGWSLGALIAIETFLLGKERLSGLVLISGTPRFVQSHDFPYGLSRVEADGMAKKVHRDINRALEGFTARMFASGELDDPSLAAMVQNLLSTMPMPTADVALQALDALVEADLRDRLAMIDCPTLIMNGDCDVICLPQASEFMSMQIPASRRIVFSGCGHVPFLTQSSKFNACLENFRGG